MTKYVSLSGAESNITGTAEMTPHVRGEVNLLYGTVGTEGTSKGFLSSVSKDMSLEVVLDCCGIYAVRA